MLMILRWGKVIPTHLLFHRLLLHKALWFTPWYPSNYRQGVPMDSKPFQTKQVASLPESGQLGLVSGRECLWRVFQAAWSSCGLVSSARWSFSKFDCLSAPLWCPGHLLLWSIACFSCATFIAHCSSLVLSSRFLCLSACLVRPCFDMLLQMPMQVKSREQFESDGCDNCESVLDAWEIPILNTKTLFQLVFFCRSFT